MVTDLGDMSPPLSTTVNPFSELIRELRLRRGLRQADLALMLGCTRKTITAIENGVGIGERLGLVERLGGALALGEEERLALAEAARRSQRTYTIPEEAPSQAYDLVRELFDHLDRLTQREITVIRDVLTIRSDERLTHRGPVPRLVRKDKIWRSERVP